MFLGLVGLVHPCLSGLSLVRGLQLTPELPSPLTIPRMTLHGRNCPYQTGLVLLRHVSHDSLKDLKYWLVVSTPLKNMKVSWDDDIPKIWKVIKAMFQPTNQITNIEEPIDDEEK